MGHLQSHWLLGALAVAILSSTAYGVDGVVLINQNTALAGNVTPGDAPGFPVTISQAGSYRLSGNLTVPDANTTAIQVTADNVTIDLNGFSIIGPVVCTGSPFVTSCSASFGASGSGVDGGGHLSITVMNGSVRGMGNYGIYLDGAGSSVEKVHADSNAFVGIHARGTVSGNTATRNGVLGIDATGTVSGNTATGHVSQGINVNCPSSVVGNTTSGNGVAGITNSGVGCTFANNAP
jgi:hypothetical protein